MHLRYWPSEAIRARVNAQLICTLVGGLCIKGMNSNNEQSCVSDLNSIFILHCPQLMEPALFLFSIDRYLPHSLVMLLSHLLFI